MKQRSSKRAILMWTFGSFTKPVATVTIGLFIFYLIVYFAIGSTAGGLFQTVRAAGVYIIGGLGAAVVFLFLSFFSNAWLKYFGQYYELEPDSLKVVEGILEQRESYIPYANIENVDIKITVAEQIWGLSDVMVYTAAPSGKENPKEAEGYIAGLKYRDAIALKDELLRRMK